VHILPIPVPFYEITLPCRQGGNNNFEEMSRTTTLHTNTTKATTASVNYLSGLNIFKREGVKLSNGQPFTKPANL
jgi:hypothetical protein